LKGSVPSVATTAAARRRAVARGSSGRAAERGARAGRRYGILVLDRIIQVLSCFTSASPDLRLLELQARLGIHKSSLFRILEAMRGHRLVESDPATGKYHLGLRLFELGSLAVARLEIAQAAMPPLEWLVGRTGETAHLCVRDGAEVVYIAKVESKHVLRMPSGVGRRNPAYCTGVGKAILAFLPDEDLERYVQRTHLKAFTPQTITSPDQLLANLRATRNRGYAVDDGELHEGLRCVAAPVRDHSGAPIASISIAGPSVRMAKAKLPKYALDVMKAASMISEDLGYRGTRRPALQG
jgi:DNA-binding IclR family transcriptional regulator